MAKQIGQPNYGRPIAAGKIETIDLRIAQKTVLTQWAQRRIKQRKMIFRISLAPEKITVQPFRRPLSLALVAIGEKLATPRATKRFASIL